MKAKYYIGILSVLLFTGSTVKAQIADMIDYRNDDARIVVNNYYDDYDYYFSSRINRFHRSYTAFNYYAPVFTDAYWYNYQPYSLGISIYGGGGFGIGYSYNYPVYSYDYGYNNGGYDPYFGNSYYWGYDPFYYNNWYTPVIFNVRIRNRWSNNYYGWNRHNHGYNDYRPVYNTYNNYNNYSSKRYSSSGNSSGRRADNISESSSGNVSRREVSTGNSPRNAVDKGNSNIPVRRSTEVRSNTNINNGNSSNNNRNQNQNLNNGRNNVRTNTGSDMKSATPSNVQVNKRVVQPTSVSRRTSVSSGSGSTPSRSVRTPARSSSSSKSGTSASKGRSTSTRSESKAATSKSTSSSEKSTRRK